MFGGAAAVYRRAVRALHRRGLGGAILGVILLATSVVPAAARSAPSEAGNFAVYDRAVATYVQGHGGAASLGKPISNPMLLLGRRVQLFERAALEIRPDGSVGSVDVVGGDLLRLFGVTGAGAAADPGLAARFASAFRGTVRCADLPRDTACDSATLLAIATDVWGTPTSAPVVDPHDPEFAYQAYQRGVLVYSSKAGDAQWLLLGSLIKQILLGSSLPSEMLTRIAGSPALSRLYAQYDPLARDGVTRPEELTATSLTGAFGISAAVLPGFTRPTVDTRFGVAQGFQEPGLMAELHAGWERVVLPWDQIQPDRADDFTHLGATLPADRLRADVSRGIHVTGVLQFTPKWAQLDAQAGQRSPPRNLERPFDDPGNYWGRFVYETVHYYAGQIDDWIIWNEPDFREGDPGGDAYSWSGSDDQFARLLAVGYLAAKKANPSAVVSFPATSYWVDEISSPKRTPFYERLLRLLVSDPRAVDNNLYHDTVALNLYHSPDDVYRVHSVFSMIQRRYGVHKPILLTELNAMPTDDPQATCADRPAPPGPRVTLAQQAAFTIQSFALAAAAGYQRVEFYSMVDDSACQNLPWGLVRANGSRRPAATALRTALSYFSQFTAVQFAPLARHREAWSAWPSNPSSYVPNWQVYQVVFDRPRSQRVTVLWNGDAKPVRVRVVKHGASARIVDRQGIERAAVDDTGAWTLDLPAAAAGASSDDVSRDPDDYHVIGGDPLLLVEEAVDPLTPVIPPQLVAG